MNGLGRSLALNLLAILVGNSNSLSTGASKFMALSSTDPLPDGSGITEPDSSCGYTRALIGNSSQALTQTFATGTYDSTTKEATVTNTKQIKFDRLSAAGGTVSYFAIYDAETSGNLLWYGTIKDSNGNDTTLTLSSGESVVIEVGAATVKFKPTSD